jgi:hypothetical protein
MHADQSQPITPSLPHPAAAVPFGLSHVIDPTQLADRIAIGDVFSRWAIAFDECRRDIVGDMFTESATFTMTAASGQVLQACTDRTTLLARVDQIFGNKVGLRRHFISNMLVETLGDDSASAIAYALVVTEGHVLDKVAIYRANLQRGHNGLWRFSDLAITHE